MFLLCFTPSGPLSLSCGRRVARRSVNGDNVNQELRTRSLTLVKTNLIGYRRINRPKGRRMDDNCIDVDFVFRRRRAIQEEAEYRAHLDRLWLGIPTVVSCIEVLRSAGVWDKEISCLLRRAADTLAQS